MARGSGGHHAFERDPNSPTIMESFTAENTAPEDIERIFRDWPRIEAKRRMGIEKGKMRMALLRESDCSRACVCGGGGGPTKAALEEGRREGGVVCEKCSIAIGKVQKKARRQKERKAKKDEERRMAVGLLTGPLLRSFLDELDD